jgi:hypothetical protein
MKNNNEEVDNILWLLSKSIKDQIFVLLEFKKQLRKPKMYEAYSNE